MEKKLRMHCDVVVTGDDLDFVDDISNKEWTDTCNEIFGELLVNYAGIGVNLGNIRVEKK